MVGRKGIIRLELRGAAGQHTGAYERYNDGGWAEEKNGHRYVCFGKSVKQDKKSKYRDW